MKKDKEWGACHPEPVNGASAGRVRDEPRCHLERGWVVGRAVEGSSCDAQWSQGDPSTARPTTTHAQDETWVHSAVSGMQTSYLQVQRSFSQVQPFSSRMQPFSSHVQPFFSQVQAFSSQVQPFSSQVQAFS